MHSLWSPTELTRRMLSLEECRKLVPDKDISDADLEIISNHLYTMAEVTGDLFLSQPPTPTDNPIYEELEERAAIMEHNGKMSRKEAENLSAEFAVARFRKRKT